MFGKINKFKDAVSETQKQLEEMSVEATSQEELVKIEMTGNKMIKNIQIDPSRLFPENQEMIEDYLLKTINDALEKADQLKKSEIKKNTEGLMPNIPGLDLGEFGF